MEGRRSGQFGEEHTKTSEMLEAQQREQDQTQHQMTINGKQVKFTRVSAAIETIIEFNKGQEEKGKESTGGSQKDKYMIPPDILLTNMIQFCGKARRTISTLYSIYKHFQEEENNPPFLSYALSQNQLYGKVNFSPERLQRERERGKRVGIGKKQKNEAIEARGGSQGQEKNQRMSQELLQLTMAAVRQGATMKVLAEEQKKDINHHIFRANTLLASDVLEMFKRVQQKYEESPNLVDSVQWIEHEKKVFHCFLLAYVCVNRRRLIEITNSEWKTFSDLFHHKDPLLLQYEGKIIQKSQERVRWADFEEHLLHQCTRSQSHPKWTQLSRDIFLKSGGVHFKTPKQCREHWNNHLNENIYRQGWTIEEDIIVLDFVAEKGRRWAKLAPLLHHKRTQHMIKNRYHSMLTYAKKMLKSKNRQADKTQSQMLDFLRGFLNKKQRQQDRLHEGEDFDLEGSNSQQSQQDNQDRAILKVEATETIKEVGFNKRNKDRQEGVKEESSERQNGVLTERIQREKEVVGINREAQAWWYPCYPQQAWCFNMPSQIYPPFTVYPYF